MADDLWDLNPWQVHTSDGELRTQVPNFPAAPTLPVKPMKIEVDRKRAALAFRCPKCKAENFHPCFRPHHSKPGVWSRLPRKNPHPARIAKALLVAEDCK